MSKVQITGWIHKCQEVLTQLLLIQEMSPLIYIHDP